MGAQPADSLDPAIAFDVQEWLGSEDGQTAVRRALSSLNLPAHFDSYLETMVAGEAERFIANGGVIQSAAGWGVTRLRARALDLVRSPQVKRRAKVTPEEHEIVGEDDGYLDDTFGVVPAMAVEAFRRALLCSADDPWVVSAAFTVVTLSFDRAEPGETCPRPDGGATTIDAHQWVGLWYAGRRQCFEGPGRSAPNVRQQRSRDCRRVRELLRRMAESEGWDGDG